MGSALGPAAETLEYLYSGVPPDAVAAGDQKESVAAFLLSLPPVGSAKL